MKGQRMMTSLSFINPKFIQEAEYANNMEKGNHRSGRRLGLIILAACLAFALAGVAYAANIFGLRELLSQIHRNFPEAAYHFIQPETASAEAANWSCSITESLSDANTVMATVTIQGGDEYIIAPTDAIPQDSVGIIGLSGTQTLAELAKSQGKKLLFVGASIEQVGDTAMLDGSQHMQSISESEMIILTTSTMDSPISGTDAICQVYALEDGSNDVQQVVLPFTLNQAPAGKNQIYYPESPDAIACMTVGNASITKSPLGYSISFLETVIDKDAYNELMKTEIEGLTYSEGGSRDNGDGTFTFHANNCQGTLGDILKVNYYNWDKEYVGTIEFRLTSD